MAKNSVRKIDNGQDIQIGDRYIYQGADTKKTAKLLQAENTLRERVRSRIEELQKSYDADELINLDKECQQDQVEHPDNLELNSKYQAEIQNRSIFDIFKDANRQLLILGEAGAGKTTTMIELAKASIDLADRQSDAPIPVFLKLSSWEKEQKNMFYWLVKALKEKYCLKIEKEVLKELLSQNKLLLILDGLDELGENSRKKCVGAINHLLKQEQIQWCPCIVISSRRQEYEILDKLQLNRAIYLRPLSDAQIQEYVLRDREREIFWQTLQEQDRKKLSDVLQRPLFLKIACDAMTKISIDELNSFTCLEDRQRYLSISYIRWCLLKESEDAKREKWWCLLKKDKSAKREEKKDSLVWLAQQLQNHGQTEFFIEKMQPSWLPSGTRKWYVLLVALSIILILSLPLIVFICIARNFNILNMCMYLVFIIGIFVAAVSASLHPKIEVFEESIVNATFRNHNINLSNFGQNLIFFILFAVGLLIFLSLSIIPHYVVKLIGIILFSGLLMFGISRLNGHELQEKTRTNQGIRNSAKNAACVAIFIAITVATGLSIKFPFKLFILQFRSSLLMIGLPFGLTCALHFGGLTCIQHFILRLILVCHGRPWNYTEFLDNAVKLKLLRRVGGRYEFIHSLLKECFAKLHE
ncbi:NACHT domain-containing protein [Microcoleus vaginatus]|uniref:NACHT domain-containing protein n=1 Tax=Microcoleus vaginatus TaxID=119532 RepID=UPI0016899FCE|nr:NACHT domain-containing protein [Microcoleus sp. FACHB-84]MBD2011760.1 NACHT domain-containing protein [Microcoleus sp. FACHB-45]